jgi:hypothetical protein
MSTCYIFLPEDDPSGSKHVHVGDKFNVHGTVHRYCILKHNHKDTTCTIFFIVVSALHVSSGFSAHHQELKNCTCSIGYLSNLFAATANVGESDTTSSQSPALAVAANRFDKNPMLHVQFLSS